MRILCQFFEISKVELLSVDGFVTDELSQIFSTKQIFEIRQLAKCGATQPAARPNAFL